MRSAAMHDSPEGVPERERPSHRVLREIVWACRIVGWILIPLAVLNALPFHKLDHFGFGVRLFVSGVLFLVAVAWLIGVELFLRFFDRYLSRN